jgi:2-phospho-L-lactate/phosphoenolpyruvate guanylyltransferase
MNRLAILVPVKPFALGKSRLESVLSAAERATLNRILALRTFAVARELRDLSEVFVVSKSDEVLTLASDHSLVRVQEPYSASLNDALTAGCLEAKAHGHEAIAVLPVDLIFLTSQHIRNILQAAGNADVCIVPDSTGTGTNFIYWRSIECAHFRFGPSSALHHRLHAQSKALSVNVVENQDLAFDLDSPADFQRWKRDAIGAPKVGAHRASA